MATPVLTSLYPTYQLSLNYWKDWFLLESQNISIIINFYLSTNQPTVNITQQKQLYSKSSQTFSRQPTKENSHFSSYLIYRQHLTPWITTYFAGDCNIPLASTDLHSTGSGPISTDENARLRLVTQLRRGFCQSAVFLRNRFSLQPSSQYILRTCQESSPAMGCDHTSMPTTRRFTVTVMSTTLQSFPRWSRRALTTSTNGWNRVAYKLNSNN